MAAAGDRGGEAEPRAAANGGRSRGGGRRIIKKKTKRDPRDSMYPGGRTARGGDPSRKATRYSDRMRSRGWFRPGRIQRDGGSGMRCGRAWTESPSQRDCGDRGGGCGGLRAGRSSLEVKLMKASENLAGSGVTSLTAPSPARHGGCKKHRNRRAACPLL